MAAPPADDLAQPGLVQLVQALPHGQVCFSGQATDGLTHDGYVGSRTAGTKEVQPLYQPA